jgi:hypothetical protein
VITCERQLVVGIDGQDDCRDGALPLPFSVPSQSRRRNEQERDLREAEEWFEAEK